MITMMMTTMMTKTIVFASPNCLESVFAMISRSLYLSPHPPPTAHACGVIESVLGSGTCRFRDAAQGPGAQLDWRSWALRIAEEE